MAGKVDNTRKDKRPDVKKGSGKAPETPVKKIGLVEKFKLKMQGPVPLKFGIILVIAVTLARLLLSLIPSYKVDMGVYRSWSYFLSDRGSIPFYNEAHSVYGPVYMYLLWFTGKLATGLRMHDLTHEYFIKIWAVLSDLVGGYIIYLIGKRYQKDKMGALLGSVYALNPAIFINSSMWGQFDSFPATLVLASLYYYNIKSNVRGAIYYTLAVLAKPQSIFFAPAILVLFFKGFSLKDKEYWKNIGKSCIGVFVTYVVALVPFFWPSGNFGRWFINLILWVPNHYLASAADYPFATANGFNLWTIFGGQAVFDNEKFMGLTYLKWGFILYGIVVLLAVVLMIRKNKSVMALYYSAFFLYFGAFMFMTKMHERYLVPAIVFITVCILWDAKLWIPMILISAACFMNQWRLYSMAWSEEFWVDGSDKIAFYVAIGSMVVMLYAISYIIVLIMKKKKKKAQNGGNAVGGTPKVELAGTGLRESAPVKKDKQ